jgi:hypothetical protein
MLVTMAAVVAAGCTIVPARMRVDETVAPDCAFVVDQKTPTGFVLEVAAQPYYFVPDPDGATLTGRRCFVSVAAELARRDGRQAITPSVAEMAITSNRNLDGRYLVTVAGVVKYAP